MESYPHRRFLHLQRHCRFLDGASFYGDGPHDFLLPATEAAYRLLDVLGIFNPVAVSMNILVWTFNQILPGQPQAGVTDDSTRSPTRTRRTSGPTASTRPQAS